MTKNTKHPPPSKDSALKGAAKLLYEKMLGIVLSLSPGSPLPPVNMLKEEFNVGYSVLRRALRKLESEGRICIRKNKGVFAMSGGKKAAPEKRPAPDGLEIIPWAVLERPPLRVGFIGGAGPGEFWTKICSRYNSVNPGRRVELVATGPDMAEDVARRRSDLDVVLFQSHLKKGMLYRGECFHDLRPLMEDAPLDLKIRDCAWFGEDGGFVDGVAPLVSMSLLACRKDVSRRAGLFRDSTPNFRELVECVKKTAKSFPERRRYVFLGYMSFFFAFGAGFCVSPRDSAGFRGAAVERALGFLREITEKEKLSPYCSETYHLYSGGGFPFHKECAMFETHCSNGRGGDMIFLPVPVDGENGRRPLFAPVMTVCANSLRPEDAWSFISFVLSEEGQKLVAGSGLGVPACPDVPVLDVDPHVAGAMTDSAVRGVMAYRNAYGLYESRFMIEMLVEKWLRGGASLDDTRREVEKRIAVAMEKDQRVLERNTKTNKTKKGREKDA